MTGLGAQRREVGGAWKAGISRINELGSGWWLFLTRWFHTELFLKWPLESCAVL